MRARSRFTITCFSENVNGSYSQSTDGMTVLFVPSAPLAPPNYPCAFAHCFLRQHFHFLPTKSFTAAAFGSVSFRR
jgi:hypothetical protein